MYPSHLYLASAVRKSVAIPRHRHVVVPLGYLPATFIRVAVRRPSKEAVVIHSLSIVGVLRSELTTMDELMYRNNCKLLGRDATPRTRYRYEL